MTDRNDLTEGAREFLAGRRDALTSADLDPVGTALFSNYQRAMAAKSQGDLRTAAELLEKSCQPPSCYHGHYRELFKIWRQWNREALAAGRYDQVVDRVRKMARYDDEMIHAFFNANEWVRRQHYPPTYFDNYRKLKITDIRHLAKAAEALCELEASRLAEELAAAMNLRRRGA